MKPLLLLLSVAALALNAARAPADVPSAQTSTVDPCLVFCPAGDVTFNVIVRKLSGQTMPGADVVIEYSSCPLFRVCALNGSESYNYFPESSVIRTMADGGGHATLPVRAGGACSAGTVNVYANGVLLATRAFASPDQNGDGYVDGQDLGILQSKLGTSDPTGDLNGDGAITNADAALLQQHSGHACTGATPVQPGGWGRIKRIYR